MGFSGGFPTVVQGVRQATWLDRGFPYSIMVPGEQRFPGWKGEYEDIFGNDTMTIVDVNMRGRKG
jgi:hypothetical protein